ncbi:hypothetical protein B7463_g7723, partial [Scytalidium lignicola]
MATVESINPFPNDVRFAFEELITAEDYINHQRITPQHWQRIHVFVDNPSLKPDPIQSDINLKHRAIAEFELINNKLHRRPDARHPEPRYVVQESEVFDLSVIEQKYYGINRSEVEFIINRCKNYTVNRLTATKAPLEPILYTLKSKESELIAQAFAQFIMAFLPPKILQCDNGKEFKGALLILLRKYGIRIINGKPRSPQTQGLVKQANRVDGLVEIALAINTQKHSTTEHTPVELLFRDRGTYVNWLDSQKRKDLTIGIEQEDPTQAPIYENDILLPIDPQLLLASHSRVDIDIQSQSCSQVTMRISLESGSEINVRITPPIRNSPEQWYDAETNIQTSIESSMVTATTTMAPTATATMASMVTATMTSTATTTTATSSTVQSGDLVIQKAQQATQKARVKIVEKYSKNHNIQHFKPGDIVSVKVLREDRTATDNRRLFGRILDEPHSHRYKVITQSGVINRKDCTVHCHKDEHDCGMLSKLTIRTEKALIEPSESSRRKRARADTLGNSVDLTSN